MRVLTLLAALALVLLAVSASLSAAPIAPAQARTAVHDGAGSWTLVGCWSGPASGGACVDVYQDGSGAYWLCSACGTTKNPGPGKCTKVTFDELQRGRWCA